MSLQLSTRTIEHRAVAGVLRCQARISAPGTVAAPRVAVHALARGTHRTRVSEMRLTPARVAARRPAIAGAGRQRLREARRRERVDEVRQDIG